MRLFLIELQIRPDGVVNQNITSYSTSATTLSMFHQRCAAAITNTTFESVTLMVIDENGSVLKNEHIITQYQPEPETGSDEEPEDTEIVDPEDTETVVGG